MDTANQARPAWAGAAGSPVVLPSEFGTQHSRHERPASDTGSLALTGPATRTDVGAKHGRYTDGGHGAARLVGTGTPVKEWNSLAPTGVTATFAETAFYKVVDGRFKHMWYVMDTDSLRAQLTQ